MKYRKTKITFGLLLSTVVLLFAFQYKPSKFVALSESGKEIEAERSFITVPLVREDPKSKRIKVKYGQVEEFL